tara:strand:+ start:132 stop:290 length:159 start_codon:yes stop_codon:yes gene_type:complete
MKGTFFNCNSREELDYYLTHPKFIVKEVWGDKPSSKNFKTNKGFWEIMGYFK